MRSRSRLVLVVFAALSPWACSRGAPTAAGTETPGVTPAPSIVLSPTSVTLCDPSCGASTRASLTSSRNVTVTNGGGGTLTWTSTPSESWLKRSPSGGTARSTMKVWVDATGLQRGRWYRGYVTVRAQGASNGSQTIAVNLWLAP